MPPRRVTSGWPLTTPNGERLREYGSALAWSALMALSAGDAVTAEQMRALFGAGMHPLATQRLEQLAAADLTDANIKAATRLGAPFKVYAGEVSPFRIEVAKRIATRQAAAGQLADESVSAALGAQVRTEVAREFFRTKHGRDPIDAREIAATIAKQSRPRTQTVAGYDLTFSPVKSVSSLWAVADPHVAAQIERAHQAAVQDALTCIERHALFTRQGQERDPTGQRPRPRGGRVHPPRLPSRRPRSAHPRRRCEQGANPRRTLAIHRRTGAVQGDRGRLGDLQHRPGTPSPRSAGSAVRGPARTPTRGSGRCGRSSVLTRR